MGRFKLSTLVKIGQAWFYGTVSHPSNERITVDSVNNPNYDGSYFHRFSWLKDSEIGELPCDWNWLVGWYKKEDGMPRAIHYTEGGPWFKNYRKCEFNNEWKTCLQEMMRSNEVY